MTNDKDNDDATIVKSTINLGHTLGLSVVAEGVENNTILEMLRELRCVDEYNARNLNGFFTDRELWQMATSNSANAIRSASKLGVLAAGRVADITIFAKSGSEGYRAVLAHQLDELAALLLIRVVEPAAPVDDVVLLQHAQA